MKRYISFFCCFLVLSVGQVWAQSPDVPTPASSSGGAIMLVGGTVHVGNGQVLENATIVMENGKIVSLGKGKPNASEATLINIEGKHVYPGLIAINTAIGLNEVAAVRATQDYAEVGDFNPNVRAIIAYNTDSRVTPTVRSNGVMLAQVVPQGGTVSGQSSVVELDAWNWEDAAYKMDDGIYLNWPNTFKRKGWWEKNPGSIEDNKDYDEKTTDIKDFFDQAKAYCEGSSKKTKNLKFESMCGLFDGSKKLYVRTSYVKAIVDVVNFTKNYGVQLVIVGGSDAWMAADLLAENKVAVVLSKTHNLPNRTDDDIDLPYRMPKILNDAGVLYCITVGSGWDGFWDQRNLAFEAGTAAAYGLNKEEALQSVTLNAAKILGINETVGSLEVGKDASLIVSKGDLLDMRSSHVEYAFVRGKQIDLDNKQKALYRKFMNKYGKEIKQH
jgi:imidazolonepropionase-like amidohydrolase